MSCKWPNAREQDAYLNIKRLQWLIELATKFKYNKNYIEAGGSLSDVVDWSLAFGSVGLLVVLGIVSYFSFISNRYLL